MAYLLLQSGPQAKAAVEAEAKEAEEKAAKKRATRKIALMKAALEEDMNKVLLEGGPLMKGPSEWLHLEDMGYADEPIGYGSDGSSLVDEVAKEPQYLQLLREQPLLGLPNVWDNMSNKGPLLKCCEEGDDINKAGLKGQPVLQSLFTTGGKVTEWKTKAYHIPLIDRGGRVHKVMAYSIGIITSPMEGVDLSPALKEFPELKGDYIKITRPTGDVDLLIGINDAHLHPYLAKPGKHCKGKLRLLTSKFGSGYLLDGSHPEIKVKPY